MMNWTSASLGLEQTQLLSEESSGAHLEGTEENIFIIRRLRHHYNPSLKKILTLPTRLEKPGKKIVLSLNCLAHVLCTRMLRFRIWHGHLPASPQGQTHPGQQMKKKRVPLSATV